MYQTIKKRDGRKVKFDASKITKEIARAGAETGEFDEKAAAKLTDKVLKQLEARQTRLVPGVEEIQDIVEDTLIDSKFKKTAKAYIYSDRKSVV